MVLAQSLLIELDYGYHIRRTKIDELLITDVGQLVRRYYVLEATDSLELYLYYATGLIYIENIN